MFSQGQLIFAALFAIAFVLILVISYRKDLSLHRMYYKGSFFILMGFIGFVLLLFALKLYLHP